MATTDAQAAEELIRRFTEQVLNHRRLDLLAELVAEDVDFDHIRPGQPSGIGGFHESLAVLFNVIPHLYVELGRIQVNGRTVVADSKVSGSLLIWPVHQDRVSVRSAVHIYEIRDGKIASIQTLNGFTQVQEEDDDDDGPGPTPPGPRWIPPRPDLTKPRPR